MDAVLGLSVTPSAVGLVLVEGQDADGATMDREAFEVGFRGRSSAQQTCEKAAAAVLRTEATAATHGHRLHSIGVTWSDDANAEASLLLKSLTDSGFDNVVPVRMPEATEALARGIAEVIGYGTTAVCVLEPETVITLIVHTLDGSVQTAVNHVIVTEEDLIRWLGGVFSRADWQPEALVLVGSGGDDELMPILERALSVPVFAPAEAGLALARGAALASAQNADFSPGGAHDFAHDYVHEYRRDDDEHSPLARRRKQLAQTGPLALLVAGVLTFTVSASVAVSLQLSPKKDVVASEPRPAAKTSPESPAAVTHFQPPVSIPPSPLVEAALPAPPPEAPPVEVAPPPVSSEAPVGIPELTDAAPDGPPPEGVAPGALEAPPPPGGVPLPPDPLAPQVAPPPQERPGIMSRIRDRLRGDRDEVQPAPLLAPPPAPAPEALPPPAPAPEALPPAPAPEAAPPPPPEAAPPPPPPPDAPPLVPPA